VMWTYPVLGDSLVDAGSKLKIKPDDEE